MRFIAHVAKWQELAASDEVVFHLVESMTQSYCMYVLEACVLNSEEDGSTRTQRKTTIIN